MARQRRSGSVGGDDPALIATVAELRGTIDGLCAVISLMFGELCAGNPASADRIVGALDALIEKARQPRGGGASDAAAAAVAQLRAYRSLAEEAYAKATGRRLPPPNAQDQQP